MRILSKNWLTNGLIDFEYKKYILLSYLKYVHQHFTDKKLYPELTDIIAHLDNLQRIKDGKLVVENAFPKRIERFDFINNTIHYQREIKGSELLAELDIIIEYGLKLFNEEVQVGTELAEAISEHITIEPIGITPIYTDEGYLFITEGVNKTVRLYRYARSPIKELDDPNEQIRTRFLGIRKKSISNTLESMKRELAILDSKLPNPATYAVFSSDKFPFEETFLPITKRMLIHHLAA